MEYLDLPDDALLYAIRQAVRWHWDEPLPPQEVSRDLQLADMVLLLGDQSRLWWRDLEGVFAGEEFYINSLTEWSATSRGAFTPEQIIERWHSDEGPISSSYWVANAVWSHTQISATTFLTSPSSRRSTASSATVATTLPSATISACRTGWSRLRARRRTHFGARGPGLS